MWSSEIKLELKNAVHIDMDQYEHRGEENSLQTKTVQSTIGGFLRDGSYAWMARGSQLEILCALTGEKLLSYNFDTDSKTRYCTICNVQEIKVDEISSCMIAVGIQLENNMSTVMVLTVQGTRVLGRIDIHEKISCLQPINKLSYYRGKIAQFDGCLAIGTASGKTVLVDACLNFEENSIFGRRLVMNKPEKSQCHIEFANTGDGQELPNYPLIRDRGMYFGVQLEAIENDESPVVSLLDLPALMAIAVGYADGRMVLYNLLDLRIIHVSHPPIENTPIISMNLIEPTDDPKACVYIWTFHAGEEGAFATMHTLMYEEKYAEQHGHVYERFISCSPRLNISCFDKGSFPLGVQSIMKTVSQEEEVLTLCILSWVASDHSTFIMVFDLNQWYKAEMPFTCDWRRDLNHTVVFNIKDTATMIHLIADSLIPFNSIHRPEEHFYPNSLTFDISVLKNDICAHYNWIGLQNKILEHFERSGSGCILEPCQLYNIMLKAALIPQFIDYNYAVEASLEIKREFLLSVALEYNCYSLLRECAVSWADGSHLGQEPIEGISLSTLTYWIWNRAKALKELTNTICVSLFDLSGRRIDCGTQKTLLHCSRQLRLLSNLYDVLLVQCRQYIPNKVFKSLTTQQKSIQLAADYHEVVQWLLNVGLLPEGNIDGINLSEEFLLVPFPYQAIRAYYASRREAFSDEKMNHGNAVGTDEQNCKYLFIDNFIEHEFHAESLRNIWNESNASGLYPPSSMQNLLRSLLIQDVSTEAKYILLCYTFMDITAVLGEGRYGGIVQNLIKFPTVFKLNSAAIKRTQGFWFLDHGHIDSALEDLLSPLSQSEQIPHWQREFLISTLLRCDAPHLALRALRAPGMPISPFLELRTLLENNLIAEAFKLQRSKHDSNLLRRFFEGTLRASKHDVLLDLALSDEETRILRQYLTKTTCPLADNVHFIHLLQKLDFVEAVCMVDKLGRNRSTEYSLEAPKEALTLYHAALEPTTQHLSYLAYAEKKEEKRSRVRTVEPLSLRLIRGRADFRDRLFHKSITAIKEAADPVPHEQPFIEKPDLGIFQFRAQTKSSHICYPVRLDTRVTKRKLDNDTGSKEMTEFLVDQENPKKRRRLENDKLYTTSFLAPKNVLTEFKPMKPSFNFSYKVSEDTTENSLSRSPSVQLTTPIVEKIHTYSPPSPESVSSYTPHGILKSAASVQSFVNLKSVSPTPPHFPGYRSNDVEEKVLRFDLPEFSTVEKSPLPTIDTSGDVQMQTPNSSFVSNDEFFSPETSIVALDDESCLDMKEIVSSGPKRRRSIHSRSRSITPVENNIAIIIEDVDDDSSNKQQDIMIDNGTMVESCMIEQQHSVVQFSSIGRNTRKPLGRLVLEANARKAVEAASTYIVESREALEESNYELIDEESERLDACTTEKDPDKQFETSESLDKEQSKHIDKIDVVTHIIIDDSDSDEEPHRETGTKSTVGDGSDPDIKDVRDVDESSTFSLGEAEQNKISEENSAVHRKSEQLKSSDYDTRQKKQIDDRKSNDPENCVQVTTSTSNEERTDGSECPRGRMFVQETEARNKRGKDHQAEDLSVQQDSTVEDENQQGSEDPPRSKARDLSMVGNERPEQQSPSSEIKLASPTREKAFKLKQDKQFLGKPKNAHEVDVPAMNLSVKPDEAHEANRKNSKSDESDDSAVLNLSTGQITDPVQVVESAQEPEFVEQVEYIQRNDNSSSTNQHEIQSETGSETQKASIALQEHEQSMEDSSKTKRDMNKSINTMTKVMKSDVGETVESPKTTRRTRRLSSDAGETSYSTSKSSIKTRRMSAMDRIDEVEVTPIKRTTRASSVAPDSGTPSASLTKSRRHASMTNLSTPENVTLTPRRSTRASSMAKESLERVPSNRKRRISETISEVKTVSPDIVNDSCIDDAQSEKSGTSIRSRHSRRRLSITMEEKSGTDPIKAQSSTSKVNEEAFADYSTNRRLTRHQSAIIEKSLDMVRKMSSIPHDSDHNVAHEDHDSEPESVSSINSETSKRSTRSKSSHCSKNKSQSTSAGKVSAEIVERSSRSTISKRNKGDAESTSNESPLKKPNLDTISEESEQSSSKSKRRGRPKKTQAE